MRGRFSQHDIWEQVHEPAEGGAAAFAIGDAVHIKCGPFPDLIAEIVAMPS